jgi:hypothetical protein
VRGPQVFPRLVFQDKDIVSSFELALAYAIDLNPLTIEFINNGVEHSHLLEKKSIYKDLPLIIANHILVHIWKV